MRLGSTTRSFTWDEFEEQVRSGRVPADAEITAETLTGGRWVKASDLATWHQLVDRAKTEWQRGLLSGSPPWLTALLVGFQIRIWWFAHLPAGDDWVSLYLTSWSAPAIEDYEVWRIFTMGVAHVDLFHVALNMLWMAYAGATIEKALGRANLLALYTASVAGGSLLSMYGSTGKSLGASGGVFGLIAAVTVFGFLRREILPDGARPWFGAAIAPYLVLMFLSGLQNSGTDNFAHFGGLVTGGLLATLLDPPTLQRRPRWNAGVWGLVTAATLGLLVSIPTLGQRLIPLEDSWEAERDWQIMLHNQRSPDRPPPSDPPKSDLRWFVPYTWLKRDDLLSQPSWASPAGPRGLFVTERRAWDRVDLARDADTAIRLLRERYDNVVVTGPAPVTWLGLEGLRFRATLDNPSVWQGDPAPLLAPAPRVFEWTAVARGRQIAEMHWEADAARADHLEPLYRRMEAAVVWDLPASFAKAKARFDATPSRPAKAEYAKALAEVGQVAEARTLLDALLAERSDADLELAWLDLVGQQGPLTRADLALSLGRTPDLKVIVRIADELDKMGQATAAKGLLEVAWRRLPGSKPLKSARRNRDLPAWLDPLTKLSLADSQDPITGLRTPEADLQALRTAPLTLEAADEAGARHEARQARWREAIGARAEAPEVAVRVLLIWNEGRLRPELEAALNGAIELVDRAALRARNGNPGQVPAWIPEADRSPEGLVAFSDWLKAHRDQVLRDPRPYALP